MTLQVQLRSNDDKNRQLIEELSFKEEQIVVFRVELQSAQEKLKAKHDEVRFDLFYLMKILQF